MAHRVKYYISLWWVLLKPSCENFKKCLFPVALNVLEKGKPYRLVNFFFPKGCSFHSWSSFARILLVFLTSLEWKSWLPWHPVCLHGVLEGEGCQPQNLLILEKLWCPPCPRISLLFSWKSFLFATFLSAHRSLPTWNILWAFLSGFLGAGKHVLLPVSRIFDMQLFIWDVEMEISSSRVRLWNFPPKISESNH